MSDHDQILNAFIRAGRSTPVDFSDPQAINNSIRDAAGIPRPTPPLGMPPGPDAAPRDFNAWADQATDAGMDKAEVARWGMWWVEAHRQVLADRRALQSSAAEDRLAELEAEATLLRMRIRTAADADNVDETIRLYRRVGELRLELLAARHAVARVARLATRQYGSNPGLETAEHLLDVELARLGIPQDQAMRNVFG